MYDKVIYVTVSGSCPNLDYMEFAFDPTTENRFLIIKQGSMNFDTAVGQCGQLCSAGGTSRLANTQRLSKEFLMKMLNMM